MSCARGSEKEDWRKRHIFSLAERAKNFAPMKKRLVKFAEKSCSDESDRSSGDFAQFGSARRKQTVLLLSQRRAAKRFPCGHWFRENSVCTADVLTEPARAEIVGGPKSFSSCGANDQSQSGFSLTSCRFSEFRSAHSIQFTTSQKRIQKSRQKNGGIRTIWADFSFLSEILILDSGNARRLPVRFPRPTGQPLSGGFHYLRGKKIGSMRIEKSAQKIRTWES